MAEKITLSDKVAVTVIENLRNGVTLKPMIGKTARGNMIGYLFTNDKNATVRVQAFTKEGGKNARFVMSVTPSEGRTVEITGKYASLAWKTINNPVKDRRKVDEESVNDALAALGMN
jgi:hypothetical protein